MGCFSSKPAGKDGGGHARTPASATKPAAAGPPPDAMLQKAGFKYIKSLGTGASGVTGMFKDPKGGPDVAVKMMKRPLPKPSIPSVLREITIQAELGEGHVNIIEAKEVVLTDTHLCLVMECAAGKVLTDYVSAKWSQAQKTGLFLSEDEARFLFHQFITAVAYCHGKSVAHRDLKLDNTLLDGGSPPRLKLCDFGFSKQWGADQNMNTLIGTKDYMAPELRNGEGAGQGYLGTAVDVWAAGVLLVVMLLGSFPFEHLDNPDPNSQSETFNKITRGAWAEGPGVKKSYNKLSPEVRDLLDRILVPDEKERITVPEIVAHPWYTQPLASKYAHAEQRLQEDQRQVEAAISGHHLSESCLAALHQQLEGIVKAAGERPPSGGGTVTRIELRQSALAQNPMVSEGLHDLAEE